jgi:methionyl-tRNA formyltransferase
METNRQNIVVITQSDPIYLPFFFESFLGELDKEKFRIAKVVINRPLGNKRRKDLIRRVLGLYGYAGTVKVIGFVLSRRAKSFLSKFGGRRSGSSITEICGLHGIPTEPMNQINEVASLAHIRSLNPDWIVSIAASEKFKKELLEIPKCGAINIHSGKLPGYRGMMPTFWQLLNGEKSITVTVHHMSEKFDEGKIVAEYPMDVRGGESLHDLIVRSKVEGGKFLATTLGILHEDPTLHTVQEGEAGYYSFPGKSDVRKFTNSGRRVI